MKATVVPNRNMIMLSIAAGVAVNEKARCIGIGVHSGDHFIYPDCRPDFLDFAASAIWAGNEGFHNFDEWSRELEKSFEDGPLFAPYINKTKADIAYRALELRVPLHLTWSCYKGGLIHCGKCGTCVERLEAMDQAIRAWNNWHDEHAQITSDIDSTVYADDEFWITATKKAGN